MNQGSDVQLIRFQLTPSMLHRVVTLILIRADMLLGKSKAIIDSPGAVVHAHNLLAVKFNLSLRCQCLSAKTILLPLISHSSLHRQKHPS